jgi:hypothetical protein
MADNVGYTPGAGATVAADDIGGVLHQRVKISVGEDGSATDVSATSPMPVSVAGLGIPTHDHIGMTYTGSNLTGVTYRTGGAGGTIVATLTLAYTGSNLTSVTKS